MSALSSSQLSTLFRDPSSLDTITKLVELMGERVVFAANVDKQHKS